MHGKEAVVEEILDWRPYDYLTDRSTVPTPGGPLKMLNTIDLEPGTDGTIIHFRFGAPKTPREMAILKEMGPGFQALFAESQRNLIAQLDAELAVREADRGPEPQLPKPRPDGLFSEMAPLLIIG